MSRSKASALNYQTQLIEAREVLNLAMSNSCRPIASTKFSPDSAAFLHLITQHMPDIPIIWVDTGYNTRETQQFAKSLTEKLKLNLVTYEPIDHTIIFPPGLDDPEHAAFSHEVKVAPFQRAMKELDADTWFSSVRRYQTAHRQSLSKFDSTNDERLKVSPLLNWTQEHIDQYIEDNDLIVGPECYDPTKGEPFRECGLHLQTAS